MYQIISGFADAKNRNNVTLEQRVMDKVVADALQTIKNGLPQEAQTVEILQCVIDEMMMEIKGKKIQL